MAPVSRNRRLLSRLAAVTALGLFLHACASSGALETARTAESNQDYDAAVAAYTAAVRKDPNNKNARLGLDRAKIRASQDHFARGRRLVATGKLEEALMEYQIAAELTPASGDIQTELRTVRTQLRNQIAVREDGKTRLEALIDQRRTAPLP